MSCPRYDFHIHTKYLGCANETMEIPAILAECRRCGVMTIGITDHLNTPDRAERHRPILQDILAAETDIDVYFGVELNFQGCDGEFAYNPEIKEQYGFQFAIGGIHGTYVEEYNLEKIVEIQHRHHLRVCRNPMVDVLVHPYWFGRGEFESKGFPWFDTIKVVPESFARELGQLAKQTGTAIEINSWANFVQMGENFAASYMDYLAIIAEQGAMFSVGSDSHDIEHLALINKSWEIAESLGLGEDRIYRPAGRPVNK